MERKNLLFIGSLVALGFFAYAFNLNNPLFWDDDDWIINNQFVHSISWFNIKFWFTHNTLAGVGLQSNYYRPFLFLTFALNYVVSGIQPLFWHLTSNFIHIANAVLIFLLLKKFSNRSVAFLTALIFTLHPLNTEAITYISGRGDPLAVLFMLLALWFFVKNHPAKSFKFQVLSLAMLVLAILSRENSIIFPFLLMVFYMAFLTKERFLPALKRSLKTALPYFGIVLVYGVLRLTALNFQNTLNFYTASNPYSENLHYRLFTFMHVLVDYFRLLFFPVGLHMERSMTVHTSLFQWPVWLGFLMVVGIIYLGIRFYKTASRSAFHDLRFRTWLFGWGAFFIGLGPVSGITPINAVLYEHWLYLPMIGLWFIVSFYLVKLFGYLQNKAFRYLLLSAGLIYLSFFGYQAIQRNILWGKPIEFFEDILKYEPQSARVTNNIGNLYFNKGDKDKALEYYRRSADVGDIFPQPHFNIGSILQSRGDIFGAIKEYEKAIEIDPNFHYSYANLAVIYANQGDLVKATEYAELLKQLRPNDPRVYYNLALMYLARNDRSSAVKNLNEGQRFIGSDAEVGQLIQDLINRLK